MCSYLVSRILNSGKIVEVVEYIRDYLIFENKNDLLFIIFTCVWFKANQERKNLNVSFAASWFTKVGVLLSCVVVGVVAILF